jgi:hypothetical protein
LSLGKFFLYREIFLGKPKKYSKFEAMTILRSILPCLMALSLLVSTSGAGVVYHYCSGELDSISLASQNTCDCDDDEDEDSPTPCTKDCCTATLHVLKTTDSFVIISQKNVHAPLYPSALLPVLVHFALYNSDARAVLPHVDTSPPYHQNIPIRFRALLI